MLKLLTPHPVNEVVKDTNNQSVTVTYPALIPAGDRNCTGITTVLKEQFLFGRSVIITDHDYL